MCSLFQVLVFCISILIFRSNSFCVNTGAINRTAFMALGCGQFEELQLNAHDNQHLLTDNEQRAGCGDKKH
jgi:hypothetical protein